MQDLGTLGGDESQAYAINSSGQIVGYSYPVTNNYSWHACIWQNGSIYDLNDYVVSGSDWSLEYATAINDKGQIVGYGTNPQGQHHAFLLNPLPPGAVAAISNAVPAN